MRYSSASIASVVCGLFLLAVLWMQPETPGVPNAVAGTETDRTPEAAAPVRTDTPVREPSRDETVVTTPFAATSRAEIKARLAQPVPDIIYYELPLREVLQELTKLTGVAMYFDQEELGDVIDPDVPIDVNVTANSMTFKTLIEKVILEPEDLVFLIRDNCLMVMSYDKYLAVSREVVIYDCRDLISGTPRPPASPLSRTRFSSPDSDVSGVGGFDTPGGMGSMSGTRITGEAQLMSLIQLTIRNEDYPWDDGTGYSDEAVGTMGASNGLLIIGTIPSVHERIEQLLDSLRKAKRERNRSPDAYR